MQQQNAIECQNDLRSLLSNFKRLLVAVENIPNLSLSEGYQFGNMTESNNEQKMIKGTITATISDVHVEEIRERLKLHSELMDKLLADLNNLDAIINSSNNNANADVNVNEIEMADEELIKHRSKLIEQVKEKNAIIFELIKQLRKLQGILYTLK